MLSVQGGMEFLIAGVVRGMGGLYGSFVTRFYGHMWERIPIPCSIILPAVCIPTLCVGTIALIEIAAFDGVENVTVYESSSFLGVCIGT